MNTKIKNWAITLVGAILLVLSGSIPTFSQSLLTKKERKTQHQDAQADRLFIEGQRFLMLEEYEKAYFYFGKALEQKPESGAINFKIAEILNRANQTEEALKYAEKAVEADPENKYYHLLTAEVYSKQKKPALAAEVLNSLMENSEDNQQYILELASLYLASKDFDKALEALDRAEEYYGVVAQLSFQKQKIYLQKNDLTSAIKEGNKLIEAHPGHSQYVLAQVEMLFNNGKTDEALEVVLGSLEPTRTNPTSSWRVTRFIKRNGNWRRPKLICSKPFPILIWLEKSKPRPSLTFLEKQKAKEGKPSWINLVPSCWTTTPMTRPYSPSWGIGNYSPKIRPALWITTNDLWKSIPTMNRYFKIPSA